MMHQINHEAHFLQDLFAANRLTMHLRTRRPARHHSPTWGFPNRPRPPNPSGRAAARTGRERRATHRGIQSLLTTTNPVWIICARQLLKRTFAARVVATHNGPAQSLWRPSLNLRPLTPSISIMGCGVVRENRLQFICNRRVNSRRMQFTHARTVC